MKINYCEKPSTYFRDIKIGTAFSVYPDTDAPIYIKIKIPDINPCNDAEWYNAFCLNNNTFMPTMDDMAIWVRDIEVVVHG